MKKLAGLIVFFSLSFIILFLFSAGIRFLVLRIDWVQLMPVQPGTVFSVLIAASRWALSFGLFVGILLGLNYSVRKSVNAPLSILCIAVLSLGFTCGIHLGLQYWENIPSEKLAAQPLGGPGLILFSPDRPTGTAVVLLEGPAKPGGARLASVPGRPLQYQPGFSGRDMPLSGLPSSSFELNTPWFIESLAIDFKLNSDNLKQRFNEGIIPFLIYAGALVFLLSSFYFTQKFCAWPLANLVFGILVFRGVLALETFFNSKEMQEVFDSFLQNRLPVSFSVPIIFIIFGLLTSLYTFLIYLTKRQKKHEIY